MLYEVITFPVPVNHPVPRKFFKEKFVIIPACRKDLFVFEAFAVEIKCTPFQQGICVVITSYSIHYTKLYENLQKTLSRG